MSESVLNKEFRKRDVERIRNIVNKDYTKKTGTQVGYTKKQELHKEGDIWTENDRTYKMENGIKISFSKLDIIKKALQLPLACPCCNKQMKKTLDKRFYPIHKKCFDCVVNYETQLRIDGKYDEYVKTIVNSNASIFVKDLETELTAILNEEMETFVSEDGDVESWDGGRDEKQKIQDDLKKYIQNIKLALNI